MGAFLGPSGELPHVRRWWGTTLRPGRHTGTAVVSDPWFDGWKHDGWREGLLPPDMRTVADPQTWLLRVGWRRHGLLAIDEVPAAARN